MLAAQWKGAAKAKTADVPVAGQMRTFRIVGLDLGTKDVQLEWVG
jgi:hypothetical protein